ncbi:hypothetical protein [Rothia nasimurium]|uniref:hypothetical protein n=1 Tax=Rothia nasimurium TaxID=85336 RepID=UPI001F308C33|nr:hypothetical protein [Rothia nasimurium]
MVKVIDKRPTNPQDSLRRLLDGIKTPASVPHGIKVAGPNDYVSFMDSSGVSHRWDGDAIATYNARLAEAEVAMAEAKVELEAAQAELDAAKARIGAASGDLTAYIEKVDAAQAKYDEVQARFESVLTDLEGVASEVEAVKARTSTVEGETGRLSGAVENALAEASAASSLASEAGDKAEAAAADAARVQALAQNASDAAEEAERKALEAAGVAASKGKVVYGGTAPVGDDAAAENLWIRSSDNRPHRWDGTRWVEVTDAAVVAAAGAASAAQATADRAKADAAAAQAAAQSAASAADKAQTDATKAQAAASRAQALADTARSDAAAAASAAAEADRKALEAAGIAGGKGKVIYSSTAPTGADQVAQNLWIRSSDNKPHRWGGSAWVAVTDKAATDAAASAAAAQAKADKAERDAAAAQATADQAKRDAAAAQAAAVTADGKASQAITAAQAAQGTADKAVSDAAKAQSAASAADKKALDAAGLAGSKGKVIYSATAPTGADQVAQNLWIRTTDNRPHRWSGSAWVAVTDKVATDAAASAASANSLAAQAKAAADKAQADATSAASAAQDAMRAANQAQDSANGKNTVSYTTGTPAGVGTRLGDTHYQVNAAGTVLRWWRWSGTAWVEQALDGQVISSLDAGKITAGTLAAARIKAGSITADKMLIGIGDNLVPNGNGGASEGWGNFGREADPAAANGNPGAFWVQGRKVPRTAKFPIRPGAYRFSVEAKTSVPVGARFYVQVAFFRGATQLTTPYPVSNQILYPEYRTYTGQVTAPAGTDSYDIRVFSMHPNGTVDEAEKCWYTGFELREIRDGSLIVNGSITGEKVNAQSVAAAVGTFVKVNAENVGVSGELAARMVSAMTAQTKNLVVTESAILQHTTLLGATVAEQLNVTKKLVARNAIVDGTLDVAQLNVTEQMAAEIVNAMSVNTKKLVVTEDAIMNQVTVIQNIVTPELVAERINVKNLGAALVTAGALQTDDASNRGVKITSTGYKAYDSAGNLTVDLNGTKNLIRGEFATDSDPKVGVKLLQKDFLAAVELYPRNKLTDSSHGAVWYDGYSRGSEQGLVIAATRNAEVKNSDPGILLRPALGVGFQGSFARDSPALKAGILEAQSAPAGGWNDLEMRFLTPFPAGSSIAVFLSPINANKTEVAYAIQDATTTGFKAIIKNVSARATGYQWIKYLAIAI